MKRTSTGKYTALCPLCFIYTYCEFSELDVLKYKIHRIQYPRTVVDILKDKHFIAAIKLNKNVENVETFINILRLILIADARVKVLRAKDEEDIEGDAKDRWAFKFSGSDKGRAYEIFAVPDTRFVITDLHCVTSGDIDDKYLITAGETN